MNESNPSLPIDSLAEEFMSRLRDGEAPSIDEYAANYPDLADEIRKVFPALGFLEAVKPNTEDEAALQAASRNGSGNQERPFPEIPDYRILREIGRGGMGVVYEAEQLALGRRVALKVLPAILQSDSMAVERFQQEARAAAAMHHSHIVPVFEVGRTNDYSYYAMQFITGDGLDRVIEALRELPTDDADPTVHFEAQAINEAAAKCQAAAALTGAKTLPDETSAFTPASATPNEPQAAARHKSSQLQTRKPDESVREPRPAFLHPTRLRLTHAMWLELVSKCPRRFNMRTNVESSIATSSRRTSCSTRMAMRGLPTLGWRRAKMST